MCKITMVKSMNSQLLNHTIIDIIQDYLKSNLKSIFSISGGKNSNVYGITCSDNNDYIVKLYFSHEFDKRDRLKTEFFALQFLRSNHVFNVPMPLYKNEKFSFAIFEFIKGNKIKSENVSHSDVDLLIDFLLNLNRLKYNKNALQFNNASEACFSIKGFITNIQERLERLKQMDKKQSKSNEMLYLYLRNKFIPALTKIKQCCYSSKYGCDSDISIHQKTLSPSDYGFHNALRLPNNQIKFIDFEYFGWDDPAKMVCDFLLHPAMDLSFELKQYFYNRIIDNFENSNFLKDRIVIVYPLIALKWCMILLNEFVPEHLLRRNFAGHCKINIEHKQKEQLIKAEMMLTKAIEAYEEFPFK